MGCGRISDVGGYAASCCQEYIKCTRSILENCYLKSDLHGVYKKSQTATALNRYKNIASNYRKALYIFKCNREQDLVNSGNIGAFLGMLTPSLKLEPVLRLSKPPLEMCPRILPSRPSY